MKPKKEGWLKALAGTFKQKFSTGAFASAARWGDLILSSLPREIPGGEIIREFFEVVRSWIEDRKESGESPRTASSNPLSR